MSKADFEKFVERQQAKQYEESNFDPDREIQEWHAHLGALYALIKKYMRKYIDRNDAKIEQTDIEINEEFSGIYTVSQLKIEIGRSEIVFKPIGTMLIGSKGRVDVSGPHGSMRLVLVNKNATSARDLIRITVSVAGENRSSTRPENNTKLEWAWKIMTPAPDMRLVDLTEDAFFDMVLSVVDA